MRVYFLCSVGAAYGQLHRAGAPAERACKISLYELMMSVPILSDGTPAIFFARDAFDKGDESIWVCIEVLSGKTVMATSHLLRLDFERSFRDWILGRD